MYYNIIIKPAKFYVDNKQNSIHFFVIFDGEKGIHHGNQSDKIFS